MKKSKNILFLGIGIFVGILISYLAYMIFVPKYPAEMIEKWRSAAFELDLANKNVLEIHSPEVDNRFYFTIDEIEITLEEKDDFSKEIIEKTIKIGAGAIQFSAEKDAYYVDFKKFMPLEESVQLGNDYWEVID